MSAVSILIATLSESAHTCPRCAKHAVEVVEANRDRKTVARKAAHDRRGREWSALLERTAVALEEEIEKAEAHLCEPHEEPEPKPPPKPRRVKADDGKVVCPSCGGRAKPRGENRIGAHPAPWGVACTRRLLKVPELADVQVSIPERGRPPGRTTRAAEPDRPYGSLTGHCHTCDKPIVGDRLYCGPCLSKRRL